MATHWQRQAFAARDVLGIAPHRQMTPTGRATDDRVMMRVERFLIALRKAGRRAILIVDADCSGGRRLIDAAARARTLGFVAIEARGFDRSPRLVAAAAEEAEAHGDPAVRFSFAVLDDSALLSLDGDEDGQADLMLASARRPAAELGHAIDRDGVLIHHR